MTDKVVVEQPQRTVEREDRVVEREGSNSTAVVVIVLIILLALAWWGIGAFRGSSGTDVDIDTSSGGTAPTTQQP